MRYDALACDYDGTLAWDGVVDEATQAALERLRRSGRRLVLVTGRELDQLEQVFPRLGLFDLVVAENGALIYRPASRQVVTLGEAPPERLVEALQRRGVEPLSVGRVIVGTVQPHGESVGVAIRELGLEHQVILNKGSVMVLPPGLDKAAGLRAALNELGLAPSAVVGVGDAENDEGFLSICGYAVAVANALPALKTRVDFVTRGARGAGVVELIDRLLANDLPASGVRPQ